MPSNRGLTSANDWLRLAWQVITIAGFATMAIWIVAEQVFTIKANADWIGENFKLPEQVNRIEDKVDRIAEDVAAIKRMLERPSREYSP